MSEIPKAELHLHIEGTLEPEMVFELARRNGVSLPYGSVDQLQAKYRFSDLQSFLDIYYANMAVLQTKRDFYDLAAAYLRTCPGQGVRHAEIFFDPQAHLARGVSMEAVVGGLSDAIDDAEGISAALILCFLRDESAESAMETLRLAEPYLDRIIGVGLDSAEVGHPPSKFASVFERAHELGLRAVAHAGEEGPPSYVAEALDLLGAERIDHGIRALEDTELVARLRREQTPLTVCPLSNVRLGSFAEISQHTLPRLMAEGLLVTVNSDDPAYFGGYIADNFAAIRDGLGFSDDDFRRLARNSFTASFLDDQRKAALVAEVDAWS